MKKVETVKTRTVEEIEVKYLSVDGKEFKTAEDCEQWEKSYKGTMEASWKLIKKVEMYAPSLGIPYANDDDECYLIKPQSLEDITFINAYIDCVAGSCYGELTTNHINKTVILSFGCCRDWCDVYLIEDHIRGIAEYVAKKTEELEG